VESLDLDSAREQVSSAHEACIFRLDRIRELLFKKGFDGCYIRNLSNIKWATAFEDVFDEEPAHALFITQESALLHSDSRYTQALCLASENTPINIVSKLQSHASFLSENACSGMKIAVEDTLTLREFSQLEQVVKDSGSVVEVAVEQNFVEQLREVKDSYEVSLMRSAQTITDTAFARLVSCLKPGMSELEVQRLLDSFMFEEGARELAFPTIVATGAHGASPHAIPDNRPLEVGDAVVMDFGARYKGYCSDMTRTVFIGKPSHKMQAAWAALRDANERCESALQAGKTGSEIHQLAEDILALHGFEKTMGHGLGHSLGVDIHENPSLAPRNASALPNGAVLTVEPGIYLPGEFGMRLEDFGVVGATGFEVITQTSHDMVIIDPLR
jgi:Xaa-Pro aminopeptidase